MFLGASLQKYELLLKKVTFKVHVSYKEVHSYKQLRPAPSDYVKIYKTPLRIERTIKWAILENE